MTDVASPTGADGRRLRARGAATRAKLLAAAEDVFTELGYHEASIVKITEAAGVAQGTFYLYFGSKQDVFEEVVLDLNRRVRHYVNEAAKEGTTRLEREVLGFRAYFRFAAENPALYRVMRQAEFVAPDALKLHYERFSEGYETGLKEAMAAGEIAEADPVVIGWALMGIAELFGIRTLWQGIPESELVELEAFIGRALGAK
jgi:AcrR family transcriptional regulator